MDKKLVDAILIEDSNSYEDNIKTTSKNKNTNVKIRKRLGIDELSES